MSAPESFRVRLGDVVRDLPLVRPTPNSRLPLVELLGDAPLTRAAALELQKLLPGETGAIFTCETSSLPLAHVLSELTSLPYEVARKRRRPYMEDPLIQEVASMTLGVGETLWLGRRRAENLRGRKVAVVLDVVSSGGTIDALERLVVRSGGEVCCRLAVFTHGGPKPGVTSVQELPLLEAGR